MYKIFLHVSCITVLEICFFFYYIGPLETDIFYSYIKRIINGPLDRLDDSLSMIGIDRKQFIQLIYSQDQDDDIEQRLKDESAFGKEQRENDNLTLFKTTMEYWSIIIAFTIFLFLSQLTFYYCVMRRKSKNILPINDIESDNNSDILENEMILTPYRKTSLDEEELEKQLKNNNKHKILFLCLKTTGHYIIFGASIITFQYLFFQYVVFAYKPLSIEEIKYYVYNYLVNS
tara:strand:+ start:1051 stop:1743 length:693 start_codon:yes stop_codon:yes gene_type:complete